MISDLVTRYDELYGTWPPFKRVLYELLRFRYGDEAYHNIPFDADLYTVDLDAIQPDVIMLFRHWQTHETIHDLFGDHPSFLTLCSQLFGVTTPWDARSVWMPKPTLRGFVNYMKLRGIGHCAAPLKMAAVFDFTNREVYTITSLVLASHISYV
jgi:hypothetical protein